MSAPILTANGEIAAVSCVPAGTAITRRKDRVQLRDLAPSLLILTLIKHLAKRCHTIGKESILRRRVSTDSGITVDRKRPAIRTLGQVGEIFRFGCIEWLSKRVDCASVDVFFSDDVVKNDTRRIETRTIAGKCTVLLLA